ncbi:hypothetical protein B0T20DRAFT_344379, partial [Sordaria brevicollis]
IYIDNIVIFSDTLKKYFDYLNRVFNLFTLRNLILSSKKNYIAYFNIELLNFRINILNLSIIEEKLETF